MYFLLLLFLFLYSCVINQPPHTSHPLTDFKLLEKGRSYFFFLLSISVILAICKNETADPQLVDIIDFSIPSDGFLLIQLHILSSFDQQHINTHKLTQWFSVCIIRPWNKATCVTCELQRYNLDRA